MKGEAAMENKLKIHETKNTKKFTILHSNDMHGDFLAEVQGEKGELIGGLALLSGYINKVREEEENVLYLISGDMVWFTASIVSGKDGQFSHC